MTHNQDQDPRPAPRCYHAFFLRLWQEIPSRPWRASLQKAGTQEQRAFATLEQLAAFLHELAGAARAPRRGGDKVEHPTEIYPCK